MANELNVNLFDPSNYNPVDVVSHVETVTVRETDEVMSKLFQGLTFEEPKKGPPLDVMSIFQEKRLLARALEPDISNSIDEDRPSLNFRTVNGEMEQMYQGRFNNVSCTLLIPGQKVTTYKPYGFLFNAQTANIIHAASHDIGSYTNDDGSLCAPKELNMSLEQLAKFVEETPLSDRFSMNEVNANFRIRDLTGFFVVEPVDSCNMLDLIAMQGMFEKFHQIKLPIFLYDQDRGALTLFNHRSDEILRHLVRVNNQPGVGVIRAQLFAPYVGYSVDPLRGKITKL